MKSVRYLPRVNQRQIIQVRRCRLINYLEVIMLFQCTSNFDSAVQIEINCEIPGTNNLRSTPQQAEQSALATFLRNILEESNRRGGTCTIGGTCRTNVTVSSVPFSLLHSRLHLLWFLTVLYHSKEQSAISGKKSFNA